MLSTVPQPSIYRYSIMFTTLIKVITTYISDNSQQKGILEGEQPN